MDQIWLKIEVKLKKLEVWRWIEGKIKEFQNQGSSWKRHIKRLKSIEIGGKIENFENMKDNWGWNWDIQDQWPNWKKDARLIGSF
jgi:hypothetical protein